MTKIVPVEVEAVLEPVAEDVLTLAEAVPEKVTKAAPEPLVVAVPAETEVVPG